MIENRSTPMKTVLQLLKFGVLHLLFPLSVTSDHSPGVSLMVQVKAVTVIGVQVQATCDTHRLALPLYSLHS